ncbi:TPA: type A chloramphenicol O-acetyltransferase, partial [Enterococcus faecium]|nr:type A chloramphenicol O-acetyltransferase [Enterococcus faecium]
KKPIPENTVPISMIPWIDFSSFNLNIGNNSRFLLPIITIGKFYSKNNKSIWTRKHHICIMALFQ